MGSGGSRLLWPPGKLVRTSKMLLFNSENVHGPRKNVSAPTPFGCYMVKPHGQLVLVSFIHYCTSTSNLSTWWSSRALQGTQGPREISSWEGLPA